MPLGDYFASQGIAPAGFNFNLPLGMSADGRTFVGLGTQDPSIAAIGWVVTVPEPASVVLMMAAGLAMLARRRR